MSNLNYQTILDTTKMMRETLNSTSLLRPKMDKT